VNVLLIDNQQRLFSRSSFLPELRKKFLLDQVSCMAAFDRMGGLQLFRTFEIDIVVIASCQPELLRTMILEMERESPGVVVLVAGEEHDHARVDRILRETGCRWIIMGPGGMIPSVREIELQVRAIKLKLRN